MTVQCPAPHVPAAEFDAGLQAAGVVVPPLSQPQLVVEVTDKVLTFCPLFRKSLSAAFFISVVATDCGKLSAPYCAPAVAALPTKMLMYA